MLRGIDFPFTHNIPRLLGFAPNRPAGPTTLKDAEELTPFAITARYPGDDEPVSEPEARRGPSRSPHGCAIQSGLPLARKMSPSRHHDSSMHECISIDRITGTNPGRMQPLLVIGPRLVLVNSIADGTAARPALKEGGV